LEDQACNNDEVKCPYCGYEYSESYEFLNGARDDFSDFNVSCDYCHQEFNVQPEKSISYSSIKIKAKK
jgi:transposase-like protein